MTTHASILSALKSGLIVSCQPVVGGPLDRLECVRSFALAAEAGGAAGLRIEGAANVRAVVDSAAVPVVGLIKRDLESTPCRITPQRDDVARLAEAGAPIIAFDATHRSRPEPVSSLIEEIHAAGRLALADVSNLAEGASAAEAGADLVATTLAGYTGPLGGEPEQPDVKLIRELVSLGLSIPVVAEGRYRTPQQVEEATRCGAHAVVVGSAITRPEHITQWFVAALTDSPRSTDTRSVVG